jgi:ADP-ribose pyrophosphatase
MANHSSNESRNTDAGAEGDARTPAPFPALQVTDSARLYDSPWVGLRRDLLKLPDGGTQEYHVVEISDAVVVVPMMADGRIAMIWQYRYPHGKSHWEVPAGRVEPDETPAHAALRELREEAGCVAERLVPLHGFYPINGISDHWAHAFVAVGCEQREPIDLDASERLSVHLLSRQRVTELLHTGAIEDGFTALALHQAFALPDHE